MNKTFSITNTEVLAHLDNLKFEGIKPSHYITNLILADIHKEENGLSKDDIIKMMLAMLTQNQKDRLCENQVNTTYDSSNLKNNVSDILNME